MQLFIFLFNSFIWGLTAAIIAFQNEWLEMRVNIGFIIPVVMIISTVIYYILLQKKRIKRPLKKKFSLISFFVCMVLVTAILGFERIFIVPAAIIREAINMTSISFSTINIFILLVVALGLTAVIFHKE